MKNIRLSKYSNDKRMLKSHKVEFNFLKLFNLKCDIINSTNTHNGIFLQATNSRAYTKGK